MIATDILVNEKYKSNPDAYEDEESDSDEVEDEDGALITPQVDAQILKTLVMLKNKEPKVYNPQTQFYNEQEFENAQEKWMEKVQSIQKPMRIKDYHRQQLLSSQNEVQNDSKSHSLDSKTVLTPAQEQERLKNETRAAFAAAVLEDEDQDILTLRPKSKEEKEQQEIEYKKFLLQHAHLDSNPSSLKAWSSFKNEQQVDPDEAFLMEYILTKGWVDPDADVVPSYNEIVDDSEDEQNVEAAEEFENQYNFRFEQEGATEITTHARAIPTSLRRTDDKRKRMREKKLARKESEKQNKEQELMRLKNLKKQEILTKLETIKEVAGGDLVGFDEIDLEKDFDPDEFDGKMQQTFGEEYYQDQDASKKPVFEDDIDINDILESSSSSKKKNKKPRQDDFIMDADYIETEMEMDQEPIKEPNDKRKLEAYLDEYYQLNYEDIVADIPTRFKYRKVEKNNFGLDPVEILVAEDKELNELISLKKLAPYRPKEKVEKDLSSWKKSKKKKLYEFRKSLKSSHSSSSSDTIVKKGKAEISASRLHSYE